MRGLRRRGHTHIHTLGYVRVDFGEICAVQINCGQRSEVPKRVWNGALQIRSRQVDRAQFREWYVTPLVGEFLRNVSKVDVAYLGRQRAGEQRRPQGEELEVNQRRQLRREGPVHYALSGSQCCPCHIPCEHAGKRIDRLE